MRKEVKRAVGLRRLLKLASFLRTLSLKKFDYEEVAINGNERSCGTAGCAIGWAPSVPSIRRAGLYRDTEGWPRTKELTEPLDAAAEVLALTLEESHFLFLPAKGEGKASPKRVAKKIEDFVRRESAGSSNVVVTRLLISDRCEHQSDKDDVLYACVRSWDHRGKHWMMKAEEYEELPLVTGEVSR